MNGVVDVGGRVVGNFAGHSGRQFLLDLLHLDTHPLDHVNRVGVWQNPDAHEDGFLSGKTYFCVVIFRAEHDIGDIA